MSRTVKTPRQSGAHPIILLSVAFIGIVVAALAFNAPRTPAQQNQAAQPAVPHFVETTQQEQHTMTSARTIVIARLDEALPHMSGAEGPLMTTLMRGQLPDGVSKATVRTDENCAPDGEGVSHCMNELEVGTAKVIVQHHHKMSLTPCLTPGEQVNLMTIAQYQAAS